MKYKWLESYIDFFKNITEEELKLNESKETIQAFFTDCEYYLAYLAYSTERFALIKNKEINVLNDSDLELYLYYTLTECKTVLNYLDKKILDRTIYTIIKAMLRVPDTNLPISDYSFVEMINEVKGLENNRPTRDKLKNNNIAACYSCHNVFYVDNIKNVDRNHLCLCPYCLMSTLYFDNDYIPMNSSFIRLAYLYYQTDYKLKGIVDRFKELIVFKTKPVKKISLYIDISSEDLIPSSTIAFDKITEKYEGTANLILHGKTSKEEEEIGNYIYKSLVKADSLNLNIIEIYFNDHYYNYNNNITAINTVLSCLQFIIKYYFTSITEIVIISKNEELVKSFNNILSDLDNLSNNN